MSEHVYVAMSGGVDSSVTAHLLKSAGYRVSGIHLELSPHPGFAGKAEHEDLELTCRMLDIPLLYLNLETDFNSRIITYFCEEYSLGRTPNPCVRCNKVIKFGLLLEKVRELGGDYLATGHYARIKRTDSLYHLLKGTDPQKDQSYFLYQLGQSQLSRVLFPIGHMCKKEVKQLAAELNLPAAVRHESQDVCFIPGNDSKGFLSSHIPDKPGEIVDTEGHLLGHHRGLAYYTIGQRQGMGVSAIERLYVIRLEPETNRLVIGPQSQLFKDQLIAYNLNWLSGSTPGENAQVMAKVRYRSPEAPAAVRVEGDKALVSFTAPQRAIAPGQSVVFYQGDEVLGGGIIGETA